MTALAICALMALEGAAPAAAPEGAPPPPPKRYGDRGTSRASLILSLGSSGHGVAYAAGGEYGYFVLPRVAPGAELLVSGGSGLLTTGLVLGSVQVIPLRAESFALFLTGRAGRVLISSHDDGWAAGGGGGIIFFSSARIGLQASYQALKLFPSSFCAGLGSGNCILQGLQIGLVAGF